MAKWSVRPQTVQSKVFNLTGFTVYHWYHYLAVDEIKLSYNANMLGLHSISHCKSLVFAQMT